MSATNRVSLAEATDLLTRAIAGTGVAPQAARSVAEALVAAEASGQVGPGFSRLADYAAQVRSGKINAAARVTSRLAAPTSLMIDADHGFAYPALDHAIARGADIAREMGTATMAISRSHHCGALSVQVERLAQQGLVAMMVANAPAAMAPFGARTPIFGTNPIAFAAPRQTGAPLVIDLSLSRVARGKVMHAHKSGTPIPPGWALDVEGNPTTDPAAALAGTMLPIGEAKGTALALMVEILASVMTGAAFSTEASSFFSADGPPPGVGQFLVAFKPAAGIGFADRLDVLLDGIAALDGARLPGSTRAANLERAALEGLEIPARYLAEARALAGDVS